MWNAKNHAESKLATALTEIATTLVIEDGTAFPAVPFLVTVFGRDPKEFEILEAIEGSGGSYTVVRGKEGTVAREWQAGAKVANWWTAGTYEALRDQVAGLTYNLDGGRSDSSYGGALLIDGGDVHGG